MKIALVHDYLGEFGGAERVLLALSEMFPSAPIYTSFYREDSPAWKRFKKRNVHVSWAHHVPGFAAKLHSPLRFIAPLIWNTFDFRDYDVVISSASWYITKGFTKKGKAIEVCYCHTPPRWLYGYPTAVEWQKYALVRWYASIIGFFMRQYDFAAAQRVDYFIANSLETKKRIKKFYRRDAVVIYPPVDIPAGIQKKRGTYYLIVSRLAQSKNIDIAIAAANTLGLPLKIVGTGPDEERLRSMAGPTVDFLGFRSDADVWKLYAGAKAFLATGENEDFGMTPVEAQAVGTPVIAYRGGGYLESVIEGQTGIFFDELTVQSLITALKRFTKLSLTAEECRKQAQRFSTARFKKEIKSFLKSHATAGRSAGV